MLEKEIESKVVKWARAHNILARKMNGAGSVGWPDRLFVYPSGLHVYIEFKSPTGKVTENQRRMINELIDRHVTVSVVNSSDIGISFLQQFL